MGLLFKNNAETTLSSGINNSTTTVPVASAAVFPTPDANNVFFATIDDGSNIEVVKVTGISSNDLTVVRAQDNTSAAAFGSGAKHFSSRTQLIDECREIASPRLVFLIKGSRGSRMEAVMKKLRKAKED